MSTRQSIYSTFRYRDAARMIEWLEKAFGFAVTARYMNGGAVGHAELSLGGSITMLGDVRDDAVHVETDSQGHVSSISVSWRPRRTSTPTR